MFQTSICITRAAKDISDHACQKTFNLVSWMSFLALQLREHHLHGGWNRQFLLIFWVLKLYQNYNGCQSIFLRNLCTYADSNVFRASNDVVSEGQSPTSMATPMRLL